MPFNNDYSRVTDPERFAGLHALVRRWSDRACALYEVERQEGVGLAPDIELAQPSRGAVVLRPRNVSGASLVFVAAEADRLLAGEAGAIVQWSEWERLTQRT